MLLKPELLIFGQFCPQVAATGRICTCLKWELSSANAITSDPAHRLWTVRDYNALQGIAPIWTALHCVQYFIALYCSLQFIASEKLTTFWAVPYWSTHWREALPTPDQIPHFTLAGILHYVQCNEMHMTKRVILPMLYILKLHFLTYLISLQSNRMDTAGNQQQIQACALLFFAHFLQCKL